MLKLVNVTKSFAGRFAPILDAITLEIAKGEFCIVIGCNGSGKSTLMRIISGEYAIDSGNILINHADLTNQDRSQLIATVIQDINKGTTPEMTLLENIVLSNLRSKSATLSRYRKHQASAIAQLAELGIGLESHIDQPLSSLSGGQRQMVATLMAINSTMISNSAMTSDFTMVSSSTMTINSTIAISSAAINSASQMLLLDEHTSALDPKMQKLLMEYTASAITRHGITSLMVTHKLDDAIKYGNRLIMLHAGQIVLDVAGEKKAALTVAKLLALFHEYDDLTLTATEATNI